MSRDVQDSVFLVTSSDQGNQQFGTGFAVDRDEAATYFLTCRHVVTDVGGQNRVKVGDRPAKVVASGSKDGLHDLAVLRVEDSLDMPILRLRISGERGNSVALAGFRSFAGAFIIRSIRGTLGEWIGLEARQRLGRIVAWDLKITGDFDLERGYSGSPVIDDNTSDVIAIASHRIGNRKGVAISIRTVDQIWPGTLFRTHCSYLREISVDGLEIYLTGQLVAWDRHPLLRYSETP